MNKAEYDEYTKEWEQWSKSLGEWPYTPTDPLMDQQAKNKAQSQSSLYQLVTQTISHNM